MANVNFKRIFATAMLFVAMVCVFSSCEKEDDSTFMGLETEFIQTTPSQHLEYDVNYYCELDTIVNELITVDQYVHGDVVVKEGKTEIKRQSFAQDLNLNAKFSAEPSVVYVLKKENLANVAMSSSNIGEESVEKKAVKAEFMLNTVKRNYGFVFNEGETVSVETLYEKISHKDTTFMHAAIKNVSYNKFDATLNEAISNADSTVYDVNIYFNVEVEENSAKNTYKVRVPIVRIFKEAPAEAVTTIEDTEYKAEFNTRENELFTVEQYVKGYFVTRLRNNEIGRKLFKYDLNLNAKFAAEPKEIYVDSEAKLTDVAMKSSSYTDETLSEASKDEFTLSSVTKNYEFIFNEGEKVTAETIYEYLSTEDITFDYASIKNVSYKDFYAVLNEAETNEEKIVYDINLYFAVEVVCEANSDLNKTYEVVVKVKRIYTPEKPDVVETVIENNAYEAEFEAPIRKLQTVKQFNSMDFVTYKNNAEVSRENVKRDINLEAIFSVPQIVYVGSEAQLAEVSLKGSSKDGDKVNTSDDNGFTTTTRSQNYNFRFNEGERVVSATEYQKDTYGEKDFSYSSIQNVTYKKCDAQKDMAKSNADSTVYAITLYFDVEVKKENTVETRSTSNDSYQVAVPYMRVYKHVSPGITDEFVKKGYRDVKREILSATTEKVSFTEYEIWSVSGEKNAKTISKVLNFGFNNPSEQTVYTTNTDYATSSNGSVAGNETSSKDGNWTVYTKTNSYSSTANNGNKSFNNKYTYSSQKAVYKNEYYTVEFAYGTWSVNEGESTVGAKSGETTYNGTVYEVYPYVNNVSYVYDVNTDSYNGNGKSNVKVCIEKVVEPEPSILPSNWGKIVGAGISAVPSDDESGNFAKKCICIRTEKGAVSVVFNMNSTVPSVDAIVSGNFVEGNYGSEYNSGIYSNGKWVPAEAKDLKDRIAYYINGEVKRNVRHTTLKMWDWRDGNLSTVVDGYNFSVSADGTLTIKYNGQTVLSIR